MLKISHLLEYEENLLQSMDHQSHQGPGLFMDHQNLMLGQNQFMVHHQNLNMDLHQNQNTVLQNQSMDLQNQIMDPQNQIMDLQNPYTDHHQRQIMDDLNQYMVHH